MTNCTVTASKALSNGNSPATTPAVIFEFGAQPLKLMSSPGPFSTLVGRNILLSHSGGSGTGRVTYIVSGGCGTYYLTVNSSDIHLTSSIPRVCTVTAQKAASPGFPIALSEPVTFSFVTVDQPPLVITSPTTITKVGSGFRLTTPYGVDSSLTYSVTGPGCFLGTERVGNPNTTYTTVSTTEATTCIVIATRVALGYNTQSSSPISIPFGFYNQLPFSISSASTGFEGSLVSINSQGGSGTGAISLTVTGPNCSISGMNVTSSAPTTCVVTGTKASKDGFSAITSQPISIVFQKVDLVDQQPFKIDLSQTKLRAGENYFGRTSGGSGTGAVTFTLSGENCVRSSNVQTSTGTIVVTANQAASCAVVATKAGSIGFNPAQSQYVYINFRLDNQAPIYGITHSNFGFCPQECGTWLGITGGSGNGPVTFSVTGANCSIVSTAYLIATADTICSVIATKAASVGYNAVTSQPFSFKTRIFPQSYFGISNLTLSAKIPSTFTLTSSGGSGGGAVTYSTETPGCLISGNKLSVTDTSTARTCVVTAIKAESLGYSPKISSPASFRFELP